MISLCKHYLRLKINLDSLSFSWISYGFTISFVISLWIHSLFFRIHYLFCAFTLNPQSFAKSLWFPYEITMKSRSNHYEITINSLSFSRFHLEFIIFSRIHHLFRKFPMNSLSFSRNHFEFTICFTIPLCIHCLFRKFI